MKHYPFHVSDFRSATAHLTRLERSIYRDLLDMYYELEHSLPLDLERLCHKLAARSNEESTCVERTLNEFFTKTPSGWYHDRCEAEIERYQANNTQKAQAGKASAAAKADKRQQALNARSTDVEMPLNGTPTNQEPRTKNHIEDSEAKASEDKSSDLTRKERNPEDTAKAELWRTAVSVLAQGGCPNEGQARTFMGKLVKDYGLDAVREAVAIAVAEQPADTREFLKATCQRIAGERKKPDVARVTVPGRVGLDPAILAAEEARKNARPPSAETLARIAQIRQGVAA